MPSINANVEWDPDLLPGGVKRASPYVSLIRTCANFWLGQGLGGRYWVDRTPTSPIRLWGEVKTGIDRHITKAHASASVRANTIPIVATHASPGQQRILSHTLVKGRKNAVTVQIFQRQSKGAKGDSVRGMGKRTSARDSEPSWPTEAGYKRIVETDQLGDTVRQQSAKMPQMIGDLDDNANPLGYSFIISRTQSFEADPAQQMANYQQQNVALLAQISQHIASIASHVSTLSSLPLPYPDFSPSYSGVPVTLTGS
ncbi:hypothetical protein H4582DRAFT_2054493 [Lactarius indigo]|nr:hypothetical protein H4582DRAFT_2054493 [Lactarius indigo]